jgi:hypothetical protein
VVGHLFEYAELFPVLTLGMVSCDSDTQPVMICVGSLFAWMEHVFSMLCCQAVVHFFVFAGSFPVLARGIVSQSKYFLLTNATRKLFQLL